jgi:hypothetical protein
MPESDVSTEVFMEHEQIEKEIARRSALIYIPIAAGAALLFFLSASLGGDYPAVARFGGMVWVGLLSLIVSMPIVTSRVKKSRSRSVK